jgi:hypothetical protein
MEKHEKLPLDINTLLDVFNIDVIEKCLALDNWLDANYILTPTQTELLKAAQVSFLLQGDEWNEEELKVKFLSFLFFIADIDTPKKIQTFYERSLSAIISGELLTVKCDCMVATPKGKGAPKYPYFFLQEFKKQKGDKADPEGQMFAAMLIARQLNPVLENQGIMPIYGAWLVGNQWRFTVLDQNQYAYSRYYDATNSEDLHQIVYILRKLKDIILARKL